MTVSAENLLLQCTQTEGEVTSLLHIAKEICKSLGSCEDNRYTNAILDSSRMRPDCMSASGLPDKHKGDG